MFLDLPVDIRPAIYAFLSPEDILNLNQTCRVLHALGCLDYVWHQMTVDVPLDLPLNQDVRTLTSAELRPLVIKALQLERNWQGYPGHPRKWHRLPLQDAIVYQMQPLGSEWLVTFLRSQTTFQLCIWSLKNDDCYRIAETQSALKFSAALQSEFKGIVAFIEYDGWHTEHLNVYSFCLPRELEAKCTTRLCRSISRPKRHGTFFDVHACRNLVAAGVARFPDLVSPPSYEMFVVNTTSGARWVFRPAIPSNIERLRFSILPDRVILVGVKQRSILVTSIYALPASIFGHSDESRTAIESEEAATLVAHYETTPSPLAFDFHIPAGSTDRHSALFPVIVFPDLLHHEGAGCVFRVPFSPVQSHSALTKLPFTTRAKTSADIVCLGTTGRRAVWLQRRWDTDEFELMKGSFPRTKAPKVQALLPRHIALPFETHNCHSLAFDEAKGRIYFGILTGGLYILDF